MDKHEYKTPSAGRSPTANSGEALGLLLLAYLKRAAALASGPIILEPSTHLNHKTVPRGASTMFLQSLP